MKSTPFIRESAIFIKSIYPAACLLLITAILRGNHGNIRLRDSSNRPSAANLARKSSKLFFTLPSPIGLILSIVRLNFPFCVIFGRALTLTYIPSSIEICRANFIIKQFTLDSLSFRLKNTNLD